MKKIFSVNNQQGFLLVSALMILLLLVAVSTIVFLVSTKDVRISGRIQGEKSAFSAAEGGLQLLLRCANANLGNFDACNTPMPQQVSGSVPHMQYTIANPNLAIPEEAARVAAVPKMVSFPDTDIQSTKGFPSNKVIVGTDTRFNTSVVIDVGVACPSDASTKQPAAENPCVGG